MTLIGTTELRNLPQLIISQPRAVDADSDLATLTGSILNNDVTVLTIQCVMSTAGKYYIVDSNGNSNYLTDPDNNYPAGLQLLATWFIGKDDTCTLKFSSSGNLQGLIVTMTGSLY